MLHQETAIIIQTPSDRIPVNTISDQWEDTERRSGVAAPLGHGRCSAAPGAPPAAVPSSFWVSDTSSSLGSAHGNSAAGGNGASGLQRASESGRYPISTTPQCHERTATIPQTYSDAIARSDGDQYRFWTKGLVHILDTDCSPRPPSPDIDLRGTPLRSLISAIRRRRCAAAP